MKKSIFFIVILVLGTTALFAQQSLDNAILEASKGIKWKCPKESRLLIEVFDFPSKDTTKHVAKRFQNCLVNLDIEVVARDDKFMAKIDKELHIQHNSGYYNPETITSIGRRHGANKIVFADFEKPNKLNVSMIDVGTTKVVFSQSYDFIIDKKAALGFGAEINNNSYEFVSPAGSISLDYNVFRIISLGVKIFASYDMNEKDNSFVFFEPLAFLRVYLVPSDDPGTGVFIEGLGGVSVIPRKSEYNIIKNAGGGFGYRAALGNFYIEPAIRIGYPYIFGAGLSAGFRF